MNVMSEESVTLSPEKETFVGFKRSGYENVIKPHRKINTARDTYTL